MEYPTGKQADIIVVEKNPKRAKIINYCLTQKGITTQIVALEDLARMYSDLDRHVALMTLIENTRAKIIFFTQGTFSIISKKKLLKDAACEIVWQKSACSPGQIATDLIHYFNTAIGNQVAWAFLNDIALMPIEGAKRKINVQDFLTSLIGQEESKVPAVKLLPPPEHS